MLQNQNKIKIEVNYLIKIPLLYIGMPWNCTCVQTTLGSTRLSVLRRWDRISCVKDRGLYHRGSELDVF